MKSLLAMVLAIAPISSWAQLSSIAGHDEDAAKAQQASMGPEVASSGVGGSQWLGTKPGGFFFYQDPQVPPIAPPPEPPKLEPPVERKANVEPPAKKDDTVPESISSAWVRAHLQDYMDRAVDDPTPENVQAFLALQQVAVTKSTQFAKATSASTIGNPLYDFNFVRPTNSMGSQALDAQANESRKVVFRRLGETVGLWYFFRSDCPYCAKQGPVLNEFTKRYGIKILPISLDGGPPPSGEFPHYAVDQGQAAALTPQVEATPSLYLAKPSTGETAAVSQGMLSLDELADRIVTAAHAAKLITDAEFNACQPEKDNDYDDTQRRLRQVVASTPLPEHHAPALAQSTPWELDTKGPGDPFPDTAASGAH